MEGTSKTRDGRCPGDRHTTSLCSMIVEEGRHGTLEVNYYLVLYLIAIRLGTLFLPIYTEFPPRFSPSSKRTRTYSMLTIYRPSSASAPSLAQKDFLSWLRHAARPRPHNRVLMYVCADGCNYRLVIEIEAFPSTPAPGCFVWSLLAPGPY